MNRELDVKRLIRDAGGPTAVRNRLAKRGHDISLKGVNMWVYRNRIPGGWLAVLNVELKVPLHKYMQKPEPKEPLDFLE